MDNFELFRKIVASSGPDPVCCWYMGQMFAEPEGLPEILVAQVEAVMFYRNVPIDADNYRIDWTEIGVFRDPVTGETAGDWINPLTGLKAKRPASFLDGPGDYVVSRNGPGGLSVLLHQTGAEVQRVTTDVTRIGGRILVDENEYKIRKTLTGATATTHTRISLAADAAEAEDPRVISPAGAGSYNSQSTGLAGFGGFGDLKGKMTTRGPLQKARLDEVVNAEAWARLKQFHPKWFDGDRLTPQWVKPAWAQ